MKITSFFKKPYSGRLGPVQYLIGFLLSLGAVILGLSFITAFKAPLSGLTINLSVVVVFLILTIFAVVFFTLSLYITWGLMIRRWHDVGCSGWMALLNLIPYVNILSIIILFFVPGKKDSNEYGSQTKSFNLLHILFNRKGADNLTDYYIHIFAFIGAFGTAIYYALK
jgi:uncharacterized membrane protein YhaH (DUF805 family)